MSSAADRTRFLPIVDAAADRHGLARSLVRAVVRQESNWNPAAYRAEPQIGDASRGLMQLLFKTAGALGYTGSPLGLYDPAVNAELGAKLLAENIRRASVAGRSPRAAEDIALSAYNAGFSTLTAAELARQGRLYPDAKRDGAGQAVNQSYVNSVRRFQAAELGNLSPAGWLVPIGITLTLAATVAALRPKTSS